MSDLSAALDALATFPAQLRQQVRGLDDTALHVRPAPAEWSILEIIGHMLDVNSLWPARIRHMLASENPTLMPVDPAWVQQRDYQHKQLAFLLQTFDESRAEFVAFMRTLRPGQLARTGIHPTRGQISVAEAVAALADHDRMHTQQIAANLAALRSQ